MTATPDDHSLVRALGPAMATAVVVGSVIGAGIFLKPGNIAGDGGRFGLIIGVWVAGGILCILGALCFAELATMLPRAGGLYVYLRHAYGDLVAFLFGWIELLFARPASTGALSVAFVGSLTLTMGWNASDFARWAIASILILGLAFVNILGVIWGGRMQLTVTLIKVGFLMFVIGSPFLLAAVSGWQFSLENYATVTESRHVTLASQVSAILLAVMWAYNGWEAITPLAEEVREPSRTIPLALFGGIGLLMLLYVGANLTYHGVMSMEELRSAGDHGAERMLEKLAGPTGRTLMSLVIMCSTFGAINTNLLYGPRISFAMGRDGLFFNSLGRVHANYRTPVVAILVTSIMAIVLIGAITVGKSYVTDIPVVEKGAQSVSLWQRWNESLRNDSTFDLLTNMVIFSLSLFYALAVLAVVVLRVREPLRPRPYRAWGYPVVPVVFLAVYVWFLWQIYVSNPLESRAGLGCLLLGVPAFFVYRASRKDAPTPNLGRNDSSLHV